MKKKVVLSAMILAILCYKNNTTFAFSLNDTFTSDNSRNIYTCMGNSEYMISADNGVYGRGTDVYGLSSSGKVDTHGLWLPLFLNNKGDLINNAYSLYSLDDNLYIGLFSETSNSYTLLKFSEGNYTASLNYSLYKGILSDNTFYLSTDISTVIDLTASASSVAVYGRFGYKTSAYGKSLNIDTHTFSLSGDKIKNITPFILNGVSQLKDSYSTKDYIGYILLTQNGSIYATRKNGITSTDQKVILPQPGLVLNDAIDYTIVDKHGEDSQIKPSIYAYIIRSNGTLLSYNLISGDIDFVHFIEDEKDITSSILVKSILNSQNPSGVLIVNTNKGVFYGKSDGSCLNSLIYSNELTNISPVNIDCKGLINTQGLHYNTPYNDYSNVQVETKEEWQFSGSIPYSDTLGNISSNFEGIQDRDINGINIYFNLVSKNTPIYFNIYYCQSSLIGSKSNWKLIDGNIQEDILYTGEYDTGLISGSNDKVMGRSYRYNWKVDNTLLNKIQLIIEPIY